MALDHLLAYLNKSFPIKIQRFGDLIVNTAIKLRDFRMRHHDRAVEL